MHPEAGDEVNRNQNFSAVSYRKIKDSVCLEIISVHHADCSEFL